MQSDLSNRKEKLSAAKKLLLEKRLRGERSPVNGWPQIVVRTRPERVRLSHAQERLWFLDQLEGSSTEYNMVEGLRLKGELDVEAVERAIDMIVERHEALRTRFVEVEGAAVQVVEPVVRVEVRREDVSGLDEEAQRKAVQSVLREEGRQAFDLARGPMLRLRLLKLGEQEHVLVRTMHHIVSDAWSQGVFNREFMELYAAEREGRSHTLKPLGVQYADYALWQREWLNEERLKGELEYWKEQLAGIPERLELPMDRVRPAVQTFAAERWHVRLTEEQTLGLKRVSREHQATLYMTLLAAFAVLLWRYSGEADVVVGSPIANRREAQLEEMIGFFVNTLVMRMRVRPEMSFGQLLEQVRTMAQGVYEHQSAPFEWLVAELAPQRSLNTTPIFQVMFALQNAPMELPQIEGLKIESMQREEFRVRFDLEVHAWEQEGRLGLYWLYKRDLFEWWRMEQMGRHYVGLLEAVLRDGKEEVGGIPLLSEEERRQIVEEWNETGRECPAETMVEMFERQVERTPDAAALVFEESILSYGELNRRANQLAHCLKKNSVGPEERVGLCVERSAEMVIGMIGILKAGGAYVPLDPDYPEERLLYMLKDAEAKVVVTQKGVAERIARHGGGSQIKLDEDWTKIEKETDANPGVAVDGDNLAYVIYTSGSTGLPKGVTIRQSSTRELLWWAQNIFSKEQTAAVLASTSICFDLSIFEIFVPLTRGGRIVVVRSVIELGESGGREQITLVNTVPSAMLGLLRSKAVPESVRTINVAGEAPTTDLVKEMYEREHVERVFNLYGPSEDTTYSTYICLRRGDEQAVVPIGRPITNTQAYVLDENLEPKPVGVPGELYLAGAGLARGYWNRPDLTAEKFVPNPFGKTGGERLYRTGDLVRWRRNGDLEFLGRLDGQVKIRGYRIELGEIETVMARQPGISRAVVVAREDRPGEKQLVGYVVPESGGAVDGQQLRQRLAQTLPHYMVPAAIVALQQLPLTPNGKLDRKALPVPEFKASSGWRGPRTPEGDVLCDLFREVLRVQRVGPDDNFFHLGGDSIASIQLVSRARKAGLIITARDVFQHQMVEALAAVARAKGGPSALGPDMAVGNAPLTPIMRWLLESSTAIERFSQSIMLTAPSGLQLDHLTEALQIVLDHHDALRLRLLRSESGDWLVEVMARGMVAAAPCIQRIEIEGLDANAVTSCMEDHTRAARMRLDPYSGSILQAIWFDGGKDQYGRLLLVVHHLAIDGVSWRILISDLRTAWEAIAAGRIIELGERGTSFRRWAKQLAVRAHDDVVRKELPFWASVLSEPAVTVASGLLNPKRDTAESARHFTLTLSQSVTDPLLTMVPAVFHCGMNDVLLSTLALSIIKCYANEQKSRAIVVDLESHGRQESIGDCDLSRAVGWFTSQFPVRFDLGPIDVNGAWVSGDQLGRAVKVVKEQLRSVPEGGIGYGLLRYLNTETSGTLARLGNTQVSFNYLGRFATSGESEWTMASEASGLGVTADGDMPLAHALGVTALTLDGTAGPQIRVTWYWAPRLVEERAVREIADGWFSLLGQLVRHATQPGAGGLSPSDVSLAALTQREIESLEKEFSSVEDVLPLSPLQEGLLFHASYQSDLPDVYTVQIVLHLQGVLDEESLQGAANALLQRHASLRVAFWQAGLNHPVQVIVHDVSVPWANLDWTSIPDHEREERLTQWIENERAMRFDLAFPPLLRCTLIRFAPDDHRLVLTTHHILMDGWSMPILIRELLILYDGESRIVLPRVTPIRNYLAWIGKQDREAAKLIWKNELAGLEVGTRMGRADAGNVQEMPDRVTADLPEELSETLSSWARNHGLTVNTLVQGAWAILLGRLSGSKDVIFGIASAQRPSEVPGIETMIGLLMNTVPVRVQLPECDRLVDFLNQLQNKQSEIRAYGYLGLAEIQQLAAVGELFDTLLTFENYPIERNAFAQSIRGVRVTSIQGRSAPHYALNLVVIPGSRMHLRLNYRTDSFERGAVEAILKRLVHLFREMTSELNQAIGDLEVMSGEEREQLLAAGRGVEREYGEGTVQGELEKQAGRCPDRIALVRGEEHLSYGELNGRSNQVGHYLRSLGVGSEVKVGLYGERSLEMVVGLWGVLKAGGAYVVLESKQPGGRIAGMVEDAGIGVILTEEERREKLPASWAQVISVDGEWEEIGKQSREDVEWEGGGENLAYALYTSGSTGKAKAVGIEHRQLWNYVQGVVERLGLKECQSYGLVTTLAADLGHTVLYPGLTGGGRVEVMGEWEGGEVREELERAGVDCLKITPSYMKALLESGGEGEEVVPWKRLVLGGEGCSREWAEGLAEKVEGCQIWNHYGPTECTVGASVYAVRGEEGGARERTEGKSEMVPIGRPIANTEVYVLDEEMRLAPVGVAGELYIGGAGLARGYLGRPELTAERFVPHRYGKRGGERLYRTGDQVRWRGDGNLEFLGRRDEQVKIRGYRIELGEIEAVLGEHSAVKQAVVVAREGKERGEKRLVAYVVEGEREGGENEKGEQGERKEQGEKRTRVEGEQLRRHLRERLPEYMVPSAYVVLEEMPLTANGKLDRKRLPEPEEMTRKEERGGEARTPVEEIVAGIWEQVLKVEGVGVEDNFFELGGHSLLATQVISRVRNALQVELGMRVVFEQPTVRGMAEEVEKMRGEGTGVVLPRLERRDTRETEERRETRLSFAQQRLWFIEQLEPGGATYNVPHAVRLQGKVDEVALERSFREIVRRHEVLRSRIVMSEAGEAVQRVEREWRLEVGKVDVGGVESGEEREELAKKIAVEEASRGFDLGQGRLLRVKLVEVEEEEQVLLVTMHHIVSDGWSAGVLVREFGELYEAYGKGEESGLEELEVQYGDYAEWQREWLRGEVLEEQVRYWKRELEGLETLELEGDYVRPGVRTHCGGRVRVEVGEETTRKLKQVSREQGVTLFMVILGALQVLLWRWSGQKDIAVGTPIAGRRQAEVEGLIGFFVNQLVLRTRWEGEPGFVEMLGRVREMVLGAYEHQDLPFEKLVEEMQPERDLGRSPLFQVMLVWQNAPRERLRLGGLELSGFSSAGDVAKFDLTLALGESGSGSENGNRIVGSLEYAGDLFKEETAARLVGQLERVLQAIADEPERRIGEIEILSAKEREQLLEEWNGREAEVEEKTVAELFAEQASRRPEAVALVYEDSSLSYGELERRAEQLAEYLRGRGVGPEVLVGICLERSLELVLALLGVLKAGGAYVPLDPEYPRQRLEHMLKDAQPAVLITQEKLWAGIAVEGVKEVCCVEGKAEAWAGEGIREGGRKKEKEERRAVARSEAGNLAYVIFTSGSSGRAKGVGIGHGGLSNLIAVERAELGIREGTTVLQFSSASFDASVWEWAAALAGGGRLVLGSKEEMLPGTPLVEFLQRHEVEIMSVPPSILKVVGEGNLPGLRTLVVGGEACTGELVAGWAKGRRMLNAYGPTEGTVCATMTAELEGREQPPIGRPIANTEVYVLDEEMRLAPVGVAGELYIGGAGLARGYLGRPELTAERFVPHRYGKRGGERLYRTGDQVRWRGDGNLEFLGRRDEQVKIRGYRIELGEIEAVLGEHSAVKQAVVVAREGKERGEKRLVAYVVEGEREGGENEKGEQGERKEQGEKRTRVEGEQLRRHLRERLPEYMVPSAYVVLEEMPLTANGKLDRKRLPEPEEMTRKEERGGEARTPVEEIVAGIWEQVLKVEGVGVEDNFFELGGHSLLATQVISRVRNALQVELGMRVVFEQPTVRGMAEEVEKMRGEGTGVVLPRLERRDTRETEERRETRLSFAQQRLWFIEQLEPGGATYNVPHAVRLQGKVDEVALERSFREIVRRHEVLRSRIVMSEAGEAVQRVEREWRLEVGKVDVGGVESGEEREELAKKIAVEEASRGFDLGQGRLLRVKLVEVEEEEQVLLVTMHHIVSDGWSAGVLVREFGELYEAYGKGEESGLEELEVQYGDYAEWQREWLRGEVLEEQVRYWKRELEGLETLELEGDYVRPGVRTHCGGRVRVEVGEETTRKLKQVSREQGVTLFMVILGALQVLLWRWSGQKDIAVGTPIAGRRQAEVEGLIGFFVNQLVLRTRWEGEPGFVEMLGRVREMVLGAYEHQDLPFEKLVEEMQPERDLGRSPLFQVMLVWQNAPRERLRLGGLELSGFSSAGDVAKFDLTLALGESGSGSENGNRIVGSLEYAGDLFKEETAARLVGQLERVLQAIADEPERRIGEIEILSAKEREQLLEEWNGREAEVEEKTVAELFAEQASRRPEAVALVYEDSSLSYGELERRAEQLAEYLRGRGVGPEVLVGICLERSLELVLALLGVLKAGGAYVPLDPEYPRQRLEHMLKDAQPAVLITQEKLWAGIAVEGVKEVCCVEGKAEAWAGEGIREGGRKKEKEERRAVARSEAGNLAYVIFTSGSSGRAKGVGIGHGGLSNLIAVERAELGIREGTTVLQFSSASFDASVWEWAAALAGGGRLVLGSKEEMLPGTPLVEFLQRHEVEIMTVPPSILKIAGEGNLPGLRTLVVAGEACTGELVAGWAKGRRMLNAYGPTEGTVCATMTAELEGREQPPIGRPIANTEVYVLDEEMRLAPVGVAGELYIGGAGLARGYLGRPELTAERFVPHRYGKRGGERLYRTGDQVRWRGDGNLEFLGRRDEQVKIRGYRIELGEIEAVLGEHSAVKQAVVVAREGKERGEKRLVAYVVEGEREGGENEKGEQGERKEQGEKRTRVEGEQLRRHLRERLPEYMVPSAYVVLEEMPLTANGKLDRKRLPEPEAGRGESYVGARTAVEELLVKVWEQVLGVPRVGVEDNFFELGGDSILSLRIVGRARQVGLQFSVRDVFQYQTIAELGARAGRGKEVEAEQGEVREGVELTPIQQWFFEQEWGGRNHFNQAVLLEAREGLDEVLLEALMERLVEHHDALRMRFAVEEVKEVKEEEQGEVWRQRNLGVEEERGERRGGRKEGRKEGRWEGGGEPVLSSIDLRAVEAEGRRAALEEAAARLQGSLDLEDGPLLRAAYFRMGEQSGRLLIIIHHLVVDGVSWRVLLEDVERGYEQLRGGQKLRMPGKTTSFQQWARGLSQYVRSGGLEGEREYWEKVEGEEGGRLPREEGEGKNTVASSRNHRVQLGREETEYLLQQLPRKYGWQMQEALLAALVEGLVRWTGGGGAWRIDMEGHGREAVPGMGGVDVSRTVGWFTSLYPVVVEGEEGERMEERLERVGRRLAEIPQHGIGYGLLRYGEGGEQGRGDKGQREQGRRLGEKAGAAEISFNYLGQFEELGREGLLVGARESKGPLRSAEGERNYVLEVNSSVQGGQLQMNFTYSTNLHRAETIAWLVQNVVEALDKLIRETGAVGSSRQPGERLEPLEENNGAAWDKILAELNAGESA